jgi:hypothetical protein
VRIHIIQSSILSTAYASAQKEIFLQVSLTIGGEDDKRGGVVVHYREIALHQQGDEGIYGASQDKKRIGRRKAPGRTDLRDRARRMAA